MKTLLCLLSFLFCGIIVSKAQQIDSVHREKAEWIIQKLYSQKQLSPEIKYLWASDEKVPSDRNMTFRYWTKRTAKEMRVDSIIVAVEINVSKTMIEFLENHYYKGGVISGCSYRSEQGELTMADRFLPSPDSTYDIDDHGGPDYNILYSNSRFDETLQINKYAVFQDFDKARLEKLKKNEPRAIRYYQPKLLGSIDELYDLLNKNDFIVIAGAPGNVRH